MTNDFYVHHDGYSLLFNCAERSAHRWNYTLTTDKKGSKRPSSFYPDPNVPTECQQKTVKTYTAREGYDRGHLVASANMADTTEQRRQSHYMTNIAPQVLSFNRGIWERTESIEACFRDVQPISTWGGIIYTDDFSKDFFVESHGIRTPAFWWKVVLTKDEKTGADKIISWYFPNQDNLGKLDEYLVSVADIEAKLNDNNGPIPVPEALKTFKAQSSWLLPKDCSRNGAKEPDEPNPKPSSTPATTPALTPAPTPTSTPEPTPRATPSPESTPVPTPVSTSSPQSTPSSTPVSPTPVPAPLGNDFYVHHDGYSLLFNCAAHTAHRWNYTLTADKKAAKRPTDFYEDPNVPKECQQFTTKSYNAVKGYDRGHLVASSMMNDSEGQREGSHYMTNIAPQVSTFNQGIWKNLEEIEACKRSVQRIYTWGGIIYTDDISKDHFVESHGIRTPAFWWKVLLTKDAATGKIDKIGAWYFPNAENLGKDLNKYMVSVNDIEAKLNDGNGPIPVPQELKAIKPTTSWTCNAPL
ncbi:Aste57867_19531 [Aphanomyces stellatus]|uniref:Aste57867_19531 protein n=1 Tax=Aphanomyces stellatus TaxID=120398 RepID=A0A485LCW6_9STRA|nr:hypothetical protein As57867_019467 [Aphanomyces stellatus]VFT96238.1 Aste57867_19531 [Aphanomyces stellatus]